MLDAVLDHRDGRSGGSEVVGGITKFEDVKGRVLKVARRTGDAIHPDDMYSDTDPSWGVATSLPKGYRAVGLRVTLEGGAHGWATLKVGP